MQGFSWEAKHIHVIDALRFLSYLALYHFYLVCFSTHTTINSTHHFVRRCLAGLRWPWHFTWIYGSAEAFDQSYFTLLTHQQSMAEHSCVLSFVLVMSSTDCFYVEHLCSLFNCKERVFILLFSFVEGKNVKLIWNDMRVSNWYQFIPVHLWVLKSTECTTFPSSSTFSL